MLGEAHREINPAEPLMDIQKVIEVVATPAVSHPPLPAFLRLLEFRLGGAVAGDLDR